MSTCKKIQTSIIVSMLLLTTAAIAYGGLKEVYTIQLTDLNGKSAWLPYIGEFPVIIVYEDFRNVGDSREIYLKTLEKPEYNGRIKLVYISNAAPAWHTPDLLVRCYLREREREYPGVNFFIDSGRDLQKKWRLTDCDRKSVIILVSRDARIIDISYETPGKRSIDRLIERLTDIIDF